MQGDGENTFPFADNRPEAKIQRKLKELAEKGTQTKQSQKTAVQLTACSSATSQSETSTVHMIDNRPESVYIKNLKENEDAVSTTAFTSQLNAMALPQSSQTQFDASEPIQMKARPNDSEVKAAVAEAITNELGGCDKAMREVFQLLWFLVEDDGKLGSVVLWWTETHDEEAQARNESAPYEPEGHTAVLVQWDNEVCVVDASMSQFGGPDVFIGSEQEWQAEVERCARRSAAEKGAGLTWIQYKSQIKGKMFNHPLVFDEALRDYFDTTPAAKVEYARFEERREMEYELNYNEIHDQFAGTMLPQERWTRDQWAVMEESSPTTTTGSEYYIVDE